MSDFVNNPVPTIQEEVIALKLENEELKQQNKIILEDNDNLNIWTDELRVQIENLEKENESNELALNEGKEIIAELEGQNKILTNRILELQKTCGALTDKVEKMKNCKNCSYGINGGCDYYNAVPNKVQTCENWRLAE